MRASLVVAIVASVVGFSASVGAQAAIKRSTDIPPQELASALKTLVKEREFQIIYSSELLADRRTQGATGEFTMEEALTKLLSGTGLTYQYVDEKTVSIVPTGTQPARDENRGVASGKMGVTQEATGEKRKSFWEKFRVGQVDKRASAVAATSTSDSSAASGEVKNGQDSGPSADSSVKLEEIVVTATKRRERVQDVPISISVITADEIDRRGLVSARDYLRGIPGVNQTELPRGQTIVIRGITTSNDAQNALTGGSTVATYFGETPTTSAAGLSGGTNIDIKLVDIERVEVLRGPQGTAFGNASLGGAVRTIPVAPKLDRFEGKVEADYSVTSGTGGGNYNVQAIGNFPLIRDRLALRASAYRYDDSGYYRTTAGSDPIIRASIAPWGQDALDAAVDANDVGASRYTGGRIAALYQATDDLKLTLTYLTQRIEVNGEAWATTNGYDNNYFQVAPEHRSGDFRDYGLGALDSNINLANVTMEYDAGWADFLATYSHTNSWSTYPFTIFTLLPVSLGGRGPHEENVGEVRLTTKLSGAWNFTGGVYAENVDDEENGTDYWIGSPETNIWGPDRYIGDNRERRNLKQKAAYAEASWKLMPRLTVTGGMRAYDYKRSGRTVTSGPFAGNSTADVAGDATGTSVSGNLSYRPTDNVLAYASFAQGFRLGQPQVPVSAGLCDQNGDGIIDGTNTSLASTAFVGSDDVNSYEIGSKFSLMRHRLQLSADVFRVDWNNMPFLVGYVCRGLGSAYTTNAGSARSEGVEFEAQFQVTPALRTDLGGSWTHARLAADVPAQGLFDGDRLPGVPEFNANLSLQYALNLLGRETVVRADSIWVNPFTTNLTHNPEAQGFGKAGGYVKVDISAQMAFGKAAVGLYVRNLTNTEEFVYGGAFPPGLLPGQSIIGSRWRPRTIGLKLDYSFSP